MEKYRSKIYIKEAGMICGLPKGKIKVKNERTLKMKFIIVIKPQVHLQMWKTKTLNENTFTRVEKHSENPDLHQAAPHTS